MQRMLRLYPDTMGHRWSLDLSGEQRCGFGPFAYFFEAVRKLHWTVRESGTLLDHKGIAWSVYTDSWGSVKNHACEAWVQLVTNKIRCDEQFSGVQTFDVQFIRSGLAGKKSYNSLRANYCAGAILPTRVKCKFLDEHASKCNLCKQDGSSVHLLYHCPGTALPRSQAPLEVLQDLPSAVSVAGLFPVLEGYPALLKMLAEIKHEAHIPRLSDEVWIFTDGSVFHGNTPMLAIAFWAVVLAERDILEPTCLAAGCRFLVGIRDALSRPTLTFGSSYTRPWALPLAVGVFTG